jgi:hypothetical protein
MMLPVSTEPRWPGPEVQAASSSGRVAVDAVSADASLYEILVTSRVGLLEPEVCGDRGSGANEHAVENMFEVAGGIRNTYPIRCSGL